MKENVSTAPALENPQSWSLFLRIGPSGFDALLHNPAPEQPMRGIRQGCPEGNDLLPALETFVYDNPLLLSDFRSVTILLETPRFTLIPNGVESPVMQRDILSLSLPGGVDPDERENVLTDEVKSVPVEIACLPEEKMLTFLRRTFHNPRIMNHLTPLLEYFGSRRKEGNHARTYVQMRERGLDIIIFRESTVGLCNTFTYSTMDDAAYLILAARQTVGDLDPDNDEIYLCGDLQQRLELGSRLGQFVKNILPVIFPPALFRKSRGVMDIPFDLILMPLLCE
ncbi:MAG: DUF3822 family protein [Muribaculaceae bacterium]|nr:DUF3822 family protein [Muribaculaceae bacterium]